MVQNVIDLVPRRRGNINGVVPTVGADVLDPDLVGQVRVQVRVAGGKNIRGVGYRPRPQGIEVIDAPSRIVTGRHGGRADDHVIAHVRDVVRAPVVGELEGVGDRNRNVVLIGRNAEQAVGGLRPRGISGEQGDNNKSQRTPTGSQAGQPLFRIHFWSVGRAERFLRAIGRAWT